MSKQVQIIYCFILAFTLGSCKETSKPAEPIMLTFNFLPGATYEYTSETRQNMEQHLMGLSIQLQQQMLLQSSYQVTGEDNGIKTLSVNYDRIFIKSVNNDLSLEYDSADSTKQSKELRSIGMMADKPFTMKMDESGGIRSIERIKQPSEIRNTPVVPERGAIPVFGRELNDTTIRAMMQQTLNIYPGKPVKPGDRWEKKYTIIIGFMDMELRNHFKLASVTDGLAQVDINSEISSVPSDNPQMKGMSMKMKGSQSGSMDVDISTGLIVRGALRQKISGNMQVKAGDIPITLDCTTKITGRKR